MTLWADGIESMLIEYVITAALCIGRAARNPNTAHSNALGRTTKEIPGRLGETRNRQESAFGLKSPRRTLAGSGPGISNSQGMAASNRSATAHLCRRFGSLGKSYSAKFRTALSWTTYAGVLRV